MEARANILQIDVEDWYHDLAMSEWHRYPSTVVADTERVLSILGEMDTTATFFVLGPVAEQFPHLVWDIAARGHEVATHGYRHTPLTRQTPSEFEDDLERSIRALEGVTGERVLGHRACQFSLNEETAWAIDIVRKGGLAYDSSIFPARTPLYGVPGAPRFPYRISSSDIRADDRGADLVELPLSVFKVPLAGVNVPVAGGFYLRLFPYCFIRYAIGQIHRLGQPAVCYLHPWELDPGQPRLRSLGWYHYHRLSQTEARFRRLLADFRFTSVKGFLGL